MASAILLISCPDRRGLVAAVTDFIFRHHGNILTLDQHVDAEEGVFFMRVEFDLDGFALPRDAIAPAFQAVAAPLEMTFELHFSDARPRVAIFVSKLGHCLYDMLARWQSGEWAIDIPLIISNHRDLEPVAAQFGIPFHPFEINRDNKPQVEAAQLALIDSIGGVDLIVLARYMQIVSADFISRYPNRIINIHHSFLPAFIGAKPYHAAHNRGVKIIGATSHYVTAELDAGPILEQDVIRVTHRDSVEDMVRKGKDVEKLVLARAVTAHLRRQVLVYNNRTVIFT
ncbi:MAG: formyltetrahydrofolate deformylase [Candidatus Flexifilum sp.]|jgi:formyltetrahydrofolate deformylase